MSNFESVDFPKIWTGRQKRKVTSVKEAREAYQSFTAAYLPDAGRNDLVRTEAQKWTMARQRGEVVIVVLGSPTAADAEALFKATEARFRPLPA